MYIKGFWTKDVGWSVTIWVDDMHYAFYHCDLITCCKFYATRVLLCQFLNEWWWQFIDSNEKRKEYRTRNVDNRRFFSFTYLCLCTNVQISLCFFSMIVIIIILHRFEQHVWIELVHYTQGWNSCWCLNLWTGQETLSIMDL